MEAVGRPSFTFVSASGPDFEHVLPATVTPLAASAEHGTYFTVSGRLTKPGSSELTVQYGYSKNEILHTSRHKIDSKKATGTGLVSLAWAQQALAALSALPEKYDEEIRDLGQRFKIVTPNTSLLVLESLSQHIEHSIEPAQSRKGIWEAYHAHMEGKRKEKVRSEEQKLSTVSGWWSGRVSWWETDYNYHYAKKEVMKKKSESLESESLRAAPQSSMRMRSAAPSRSSEMSFASALAPSPAPAAMADLMDDECEADDDMAAGDFDDSAGPSISGVGVKVQAWDPATPYIKELQGTERKLSTLYSTYLKVRDAPESSYANSPAFYFDCAHYFLNQKALGAEEARVLGVRILTNIVELKLDEPQLLRMLGYKLDEMNELSLGVEVCEKVLKLRPDEPQSHRDLALLLEKKGGSHYQRAVDLLWAVVVGPSWRSDFEEVEITALVEMNAIIAKAKREKVTLKLPERSDPFIKNLDCDLRISMGWDTDMTDFDLHVVEPNSEECYFGHRNTEAGGMMSRDFRTGYGPEEYMIKKSFPGVFRAWTNYFAMHTATLTGPSSIILKIFVNWGRANQEEYVTLTRLQESKNNADLGSITIPEGGATKTTKSGPSSSSVPKIEVPPSSDTPAPVSDSPSPRDGKSPRSESKPKCIVM